MEPTTSWFLVGFISAVSRRELPSHVLTWNAETTFYDPTPWLKSKDFLAYFSQCLCLQFTVHWVPCLFFFFSVGDWLSLISKGNTAYSKEIEFDASDQS